MVSGPGYWKLENFEDGMVVEAMNLIIRLYSVVVIREWEKATSRKREYL